MKKQLLVLALFLSFVITSNAQFFQNFDNNGTAMPAGWSVINGGTPATWTISTLGSGAHSGTYAAKLPASTVALHNDLLVSPQINVVAGVNDRLTFWVKHNSSYSGYLDLKISTTTNTALTSFSNLGSVQFFNYWKMVIVDLSAYAGQTVYLGFYKQYTMDGDFYLDDVVNDRLIPTLHSDCHGIYNLTTRATALLNGQNPSDCTITYFTSSEAANQGTGPIENPASLEIWSNVQIVIYARIYNNVSGTFTINYFNLVEDKANFMFDVTEFSANVYIQQGGNSGPYTMQWYGDNVLMSGQTNNMLNNLWSNNSFHVVYTNPATGCTVTSPTIYKMYLYQDNFTVNFVNGETTTTTQSVLDNDMIPAQVQAYESSTWPAGITLNPNGTIDVLPNTPPGTYNLSYAVSGSNTYSNANYSGQSQVNITIPTSVAGIRMNAFLDTNNNGVQDGSELDFNDGTFHYQVNSGTMHHVNSSSGEYFLVDNNPANSYNLSYTLDASLNYCGGLYSLPTSSYNNISAAVNSGITTYNFPITVTPCSQLFVYLHPNAAGPRPGFQYKNYIYYENLSDQPVASGTITFTKNNAVSFVNISQSGVVATSNGFTYNFSDLLPHEGRYIDVTMSVPTLPTVSIGQMLTNSVTITPIDEYPLDNSSVLTQQVTGSYDPNDITEAHGGKILHSTFTSNDYLTYTIQFENTGTANAEKVKVTDVLDAKLDETTVRMINASNGYSLDRVGNELNWTFDDIQLVPTGKGYINFQVKPKAGYVVGDVIPNTASIFFDFNPAIVTNTFDTEFVAFLSVAEFDNNDFTAYPNPTNGQLTIALKNNTAVINAVTVNDVLGKTVQTKTFNASNAVLDLSNLTKGIYFVKVQSEGMEKVMKVVKQ